MDKNVGIIESFAVRTHKFINEHFQTKKMGEKKSGKLD